MWRDVSMTWRIAVACLGLPPLTTGAATDSFVTPTSIPIERDFAVRALRKEAGLPDTRVLSLLVDQKGFLWVGTRRGLTRYDGSHWVNWSRATDPEMADEECSALAEHPDGTIWVGTKDGLLSLGGGLKRHTLSGVDPRLAETLGSQAEIVRSLSVDAAGSVLVGTARGVVIRDPQGRWRRPLDHAQSTILSEVPVTHWAADGSGWIGVPLGLYRLSSNREAWEPIPLPAERAQPHALGTDGQGRLFYLGGPYAEATACLWRWGGSSWVECAGGTFQTRAGPVFLLRDREGALWHPLLGAYLVRWQGDQRTVYALPASMDDLRVSCMAQDLEGDYWVGTETRGLLRLTPRRIDEIAASRGLPSESAWALLETPEQALWVGTEAGVAVLAPGANKAEAPLDLALPHVRALAATPDGRVWIGTGSGLHVKDRDRVARVELPEALLAKVRAMEVGDDGALWVATARGLAEFRPGITNVWTVANGLPAEDVRAVLPRHGSVWIGTFGKGLVRLDPANPQTLSRVSGIPDSRVWALHQDVDGALWVGTDLGLFCVEADKGAALTTAEGLPVNQVNSIVEDAHGWLWVGHDLGVYRVSRRELLQVARRQRLQARCIPYDEDDGMRVAETNGQRSSPAAIRLQDGRIAFAGEGGVVVFDPERLPDLTQGPATFIERVQASGTTLFSGSAGNLLAAAAAPHPDRITIAPGIRSTVTIDFTAISFRSSGRLRFRHRLLGLSPDWVDDGGQRHATYAGLRPGTYTLEVTAANQHGYWTAQPASLTLDIRPHWHETTGFRIVGALTAVALTTGGVGLRLRAVARRHDAERQTALARERARLARDLHDSLGANLTEITLLSGITQQESLCAETVKARLHRLSDRTQEASRILRDLIWTTNPASDSLDNLVSRICDSAERVLGSAGLRFRLEMPDELPDTAVGPDVRKSVLLACNEAVNNAVRHAAASQVRFHFGIAAGRLAIRIQDDGRGFDPGAVEGARRGVASGLGLASLRQRMAGLGGRCTIISAPGQGTRIELEVPL